MRLTALTNSTVTSVIVASLAQAETCPPRQTDGFVAGDALVHWLKGSINDFFPYRANWEDAFDRSFSRNLQASFNATKLDFNGLKGLFKLVYPTLNDGFAGTFVHGFSTTIGVPNANDRGGFVTVTGWEGGYIHGDESKLLNVTDAAFAVIQEQKDCELRIVEWRETSNLGSF